MKISAKSIAYVGMLAAINVILNTFTITMPGSSYALSFTYIPTFLAGFYFGPFAGFMVGLIGDVLGCIIWPKGAWIPLITLASALMGVIPGLIREIKVDERVRLVLSYIIVYVVCSMWLNTFALWSVYAATKKTFWVYLAARIPLQITNLILNMWIGLATLPFFKQLLFTRSKAACAARSAFDGKPSEERSNLDWLKYNEEQQIDPSTEQGDESSSK